jgi:hypothetical protein
MEKIETQFKLLQWSKDNNIEIAALPETFID